MRRLLLRHVKRRQAPESAIRTFSHNSPTLSTSRPQLPFLSVPSRALRSRRQQWRYLTTERKAWFKREVGQAARWTAYLWALALCFSGVGFALQQEFTERRFPTPHEWAFRTRMLKRGADAETARPDVVVENWPLIVQMLADVLDRLEDPAGEGKGLRDLGPVRPPGAKDISAMSEAWRRGYYEALLLCCKASEHVEGWVVDRTRKTVFPPDVVKGPSNPFPKPVPAGSVPPPREEDCEPAGFPKPDEMYLKLLATEGLTTKQRMDAALSYANWLEFKGFLSPAAIMYEDALNMAIEEIQTPGAPPLVDPKTAVLNDKADRKPSANLLTSLTALATFKARHEDVSAALPIFISLLQARRTLPSRRTPAPKDAQALALPSDPTSNMNPIQKAMEFFQPPPYPPPPPDGTDPPLRDSGERCDEAALHLHIGEIMYTARASTREDGLAWTREGVDLAEEELHRVLERAVGARGEDRDARDAKKSCRACLASGLDNWATMVHRMVREEEARAAPAAAGSAKKTASAGWFGLWSGSKGVEENVGRWAAEEKVVGERTRRAQDILEDLEKPNSGLMSQLLKA